MAMHSPTFCPTHVELTSFLFGVNAMDVYADAEEMLEKK